MERWQKFLIAKGLLGAPADGVFGEATDAATRKYQEANQLKEDGIVGAKTLAQAEGLGFAVSRRVRGAEVTANPDLGVQAKAILKAHWHEKLGSEFPFESQGKRYFGRIEQHYHEPGGPLKPWGYHPGVSLFIEVAMTPSEPVLDDPIAPS